MTLKKIMGSVDEETVEKVPDMLDMDEDSTTEADRIKELAGVSNDFVDEETYDGDDSATIMVTCGTMKMTSTKQRTTRTQG